MATYLITCVRKSDVDRPSRHEHIVEVGLGTAIGSYKVIWTVAQVIRAMELGDGFYTESKSTGKRANVRAYNCAACEAPVIRSDADAVWDNNLDNLDLCV